MEPVDKRDYQYALEKLSDAVRYMALSTGTRAERIAEAFSEISRIWDNHRIPPEIEDDFLRIGAMLNRVEGHDGEGDFLASARALPDEEQREIITTIFSMYERIARSKMLPGREN